MSRRVGESQYLVYLSAMLLIELHKRNTLALEILKLFLDLTLMRDAHVSTL
jgi:hypothetical protein